jgi:hypothetical protein
MNVFATMIGEIKVSYKSRTEHNACNEWNGRCVKLLRTRIEWAASIGVESYYRETANAVPLFIVGRQVMAFAVPLFLQKIALLHCTNLIHQR